MRTSEEIYHQVRWDPRFDPSRFVFGVAQRERDPKRVPLPLFSPGGDIPWHRVLFVEADGEVVWDRATGVDRVGATDAGRVREPRLLRAPYFSARTPHAWDTACETWRPADRRTAVPAAAREVRVLTWNTLWDRYNREHIDTGRRRPALLAALEAAEADVIALQEVEAALLGMLLESPWVRARYTLGTDPGGSDLDDTGLVLLSRLPVREAGVHGLSPHKAVAAVTVQTSNGPLVVAATHLTSDHSPTGAERREAELGDIADGLTGLEADVVLMGDFNDAREGALAPGPRLGLRDAWAEAHGPADLTPTFVPAKNPLAALSSPTGEAGRLDRVLVRGDGLTVAGVRLHGDEPGADDLFASDHFGVAADLRPVGDAVRKSGREPVVADDAEDERARRLAQRIAEVLDDGVVHVVGSRRMDCALPGADLDLVAALPGAIDVRTVSARVAAALPPGTHVREVTGARVPGLRFRAENLGVDLVLVGTEGLPPAEAVSRRTELGDEAAVALSAVSDADAVRSSVGDAHDAFARLARRVKAWARARGLDSAPFGGLPGLAWSVLAARTVREAGDLPADDLLAAFFGDWAAWDWSEPVGLTADTPASPAPVSLSTPTAPVRLCTAQVGRGVRDLLVQELYLAWELMESAAHTGADPWPGLLTPPPLHDRHAAWAMLTVRADRAEEFAAVLGLVRGRVRALLTALEDAGATDVHAWPRPFETGPTIARYAIGLGADPPSPARFAEIATWWRRGLPGTELTRVDGPAPVLA